MVLENNIIKHSYDKIYENKRNYYEFLAYSA